MRILIISHNVFSKTSNSGKTLISYFNDYPRENIAQFYIHSEIPTDDSCCINYYRFTDRDALKSIFSLKEYGKILGIKNIDRERKDSRTDKGAVQALYQFGRKRTGAIYFLRNLLWAFSRWNSPQLKKWVIDFDPDVIFFASGDYSFMYTIARKIADYAQKPLVTCCFDDFYIYNANSNSLIGQAEYVLRMKNVRKTVSRSSCIFAISDSMRDAYQKMFNKKAFTLYTSALEHDLKFAQGTNKISYIGNLGFDRNLQLIDIGRALKKMGLFLDVYSGEKNEEILAEVNEKNGIKFHGSISADEVLRVMEESMAVIHTESFDKTIMDKVRYSISTKIAESLMYGPCLLAYGPEGIASIDYLKENNAAYVIDSKENLEAGLQEFVNNQKLREEIVSNARKLAKENHNVDINPQKLREWLQASINEFEGT